jgi:hypothetical protein
MKTFRHSFILLSFGLTTSVFSQGPLSPPAAPAPTMKTLDQLDAKLEKRIPIAAAPFTINAAGSYYLTTNLTSSGGGAAGITISADNVTVDLNGFTLSGGGAGFGTVAGIHIPAARKNIQIVNGTIRNWNVGGINAPLTINSLFERLRIADNNDNGLVIGSGNQVIDCAASNNILGLSVGSGCNVTRCVVTDNLSDGVSTGAGCIVTQITASGNNGNGITASSGCTVTGCTVKNTVGGNGIMVGVESNVIDCTVTGSANTGIVVDSSSVVEKCIAASNQGGGIFTTGDYVVIRNCSASQNTSDGIRVNAHAFVMGNTCFGNSPNAAGIHVTNANNVIENNYVFGNTRGFGVDVSLNLIIRNRARFNGGGAADYVIVAGNKVGPIVTPPDSLAIPANPAAGVGTSDPWANFRY